jgi:serine/threonine protein kinase
MPLREGNLASLVRNIKPSDALCTQVLEQMLSALDYLAFNNLCHRDVKPPNILYESLDQDNLKYHFQLADFGFANEIQLAKTFCGTELYLAPEVYNHGDQTPKLDIWSLFVTMLEIHPQSNFPLLGIRGYSDVVRAVQAHSGWKQLRPMARVDPLRRASAAQMLVRLFNGKGLTTPRNVVPELEPDIPEPATDGVQATLPSAPRPRIIELPRAQRTTRRPARPAPSPGVTPNREPPRLLPRHTCPDRLGVGIKKQPITDAKAQQGRLRQAIQMQQDQVFQLDKAQKEKQPRPQVQPGSPPDEDQSAPLVRWESLAARVPGAFPQ